MWKKDGKVFDGQLEIEGRVAFVGGEPDPELMRRLGWTECDPEDMTAFDAACAQFRAVCGQIASAAGLPDFKGGFDEMAEFQQSAAYGTVAGLQLALAWAAANELCKYEGGKVGYGQPEWWYYCWREETA